MKNYNKNSDTKNLKTNQSSGDNRSTIEESASHKEIKILLGVVAGILILLIGGSVFANFQNSGDARLEALEEALLNNKSRMLREYDPLLVNAVEIHDYEVTHQSREYDHVAVEILMPDLVTVYDAYFEEMIQQQVWLEEEPRQSLQEIYRRSVEQGEWSVYPLKKEVLLKEENDQWQVRNPEVLEPVLPHNPTEEIAEGFDQVLEVMGTSLDFGVSDIDPVLKDVMTTLLEEGFFNEVSFDWHRDPEGENYRITSKVNEIMKMQEVAGLDDFRHRREEIVDHPSLVDVVMDEVREKTEIERDLRVFEIREVDQPNKDDWGYRLISRGGVGQYYRQLMENIETFPHMARMNFSHLQNYYKSVQVTDGDPWPEALQTFDHGKQQVLARDHAGPDRRKLILEDGGLWYRIYDPVKGEVVEELLITEEIQQETVLDEEGNPYSRNDIKRREGYDLVVYGENGEHIYQVDWEPDRTATKLIHNAGDFHQEEIFYLADRPYHMGERGQGKDRQRKEIQLMDMETEEVLIEKSYEQLSDENSMLHSNYFVSETYDMLLVYYRGLKELSEEIFPEGSLQIYRGTENGLEVNHSLAEASREVGGIQNFVVMDRERIFLVNHQQEQWVLDLQKNTIISVAPGPFEKKALEEETAKALEEEAMEGGDEREEAPSPTAFDEFEDHHYRFTPLSEDLFYVELFIHSSGGGEEFRREIWTVKDEVTRNMVFHQEDQGYTLSYSLEDQVFILMKDFHELLVLEGDPKVLGNLPGETTELKMEDLLDHEAFTLLERYSEINGEREPGALMIYGQHYFFSPYERFYSPDSHQRYNPFRYDRSTGNLFYITRGGDPYIRVLKRDSDHPPLLPLWDYQELKLDEAFTTLYYRDHQGSRIYKLPSFLDALNDSGTER
ncbi:hypothetical protein [Isachenkonia alkalipeptolytica]|uniref:Uncharacterized protein n=1 Tax=Isachenkonia alkalipeptolytica TaxID=2565777 RepID=A0AA44BF52_9CLOT|nr:hypothetical protein [Isachenkonia alkalipeptolytica]NBG88241.1 hypothetical protein [Isachenkonia alkalipeptolytica]